MFNGRAYKAAPFPDVSKTYDTVWTTALLFKLHTAAPFPDVSKAYDTVWTTALLYKLHTAAPFPDVSKAYDTVWTTALLFKLHTAAPFPDVSKTYDTVWTTALLFKLHTAGIPDSVPLLLLPSHLTDPKLRVSLGGTFSEWKQIRARIPLGALLPQQLCNLYVADIPRTH
jgi:hypothetical protein